MYVNEAIKPVEENLNLPWNKRITLYLEGILVASKEKIEATQLQQIESNAMAEKN